MAVIGSRGSLPINFGTPGLVGLALSYAAPIVSLLGSFLSSFTETEKEMVSVERTLQYMDIPQEEQTGCLYLNPDWPNQGFIEFDCVTLKYMPSLPAALCNLSFRIAGGTQVGIIGRTGAGMSSVLNALFRLTPICTGSISIDGVDIKNISVRELRTHLAIVPQSPFLFEGSLRDNLDPFKMNDDLKIWNACVFLCFVSCVLYSVFYCVLCVFLWLCWEREKQRVKSSKEGRERNKPTTKRDDTRAWSEKQGAARRRNQRAAKSEEH
ncbi:ABC transporter C family member 13-like [Vigna unguiculata]|uniref:ABC transporter C family member 13-like n=1 Tax=Vigna unguiculata TaxID=3917 RepID=UPI001015DA64|nr:ABC transporter C family member 13-like [Vigna unguiculata]